MTTEVGFYIPFWGSLTYLREAVDSVINQADGRWMLTVVNDAHPDPSVDQYFEGLKDHRIRYIRNEANVGITGNFRRSVELATEPLVVILGYDDKLLPNYVGLVLAAAQDYPEAGIIQPGVEVIDSEGAVVRTLVDSVKTKVLRPSVRQPTILEGDRLAAHLMHGNWLYWPSLAFRRDILKRHDFRDDFSVIQDLALVLDLLLAGEKLLFVPEVAFHYRRHLASASSEELVDGARFAGERAFFRLAAALSSQAGWRRTRLAARLHLTSRLHAAVLLPRALFKKDLPGIAALTRHVLGT
ncbi:glycosyltransferase family 2 protein [Arthrobacter sp. TMN-37]